VTVRIGMDDEFVSLQVADDGQGFDPKASTDAGGMGLITMQERVERVGGRIEIVSAPGEGTKVNVTIGRRQGAGSEN